MQETIHHIIEEVAKEDGIYMAILDNLLAPNYHLRGELLSEVVIDLYNQPQRVLKSWEENWFRYLFVTIAKTQAHNSTTSFFKNVKEITWKKMTTKNKKLKNKTYSDFYFQELNSDFSIDELEFFERNIHNITRARREIEPTLNWFTCEVARLHFEEGMSSRDIERYSDNGFGKIGYQTAIKALRKYKEALKEELKKPKYNVYE